MKFYKIQSKMVVSFEKIELENIFRKSKEKELRDEMEKNGYSFNDLRKDKEKLIKIAEKISQQTSYDRDEHEIFAALYCFLGFYEEGSQVVFDLKPGFDYKKDSIKELDDLKNAMLTDTMTDFSIKCNDDFRQFQMKRYRKTLSTDGVLEFIQDKLSSYGNNLGDVNLLIVLQSKENDLSKVDFKEISDNLSHLNISGTGHVLISFNENNKYSVINTVYPELGYSKYPINWKSEETKILLNL